jgi:hypothetical protein
MGCIKNLGAHSFCRSLLATEYYKIHVGMKLRVLQILCDHVIDSEELKTELEGREGSTRWNMRLILVFSWGVVQVQSLLDPQRPLLVAE